jgi:hypothetical protein
VRVIGSAFRAYWTAALLGLAAVVLLVLGAPAKAALAGAGFAFIGAAVTRGIDLAKERRAAAAQADADRRRDLDETRRLAYMALATRASGGRAELVATLVNALAHHGLAVDPSVAADHILNLGQGESQRWLQSQIDRITAELGSLTEDVNDSHYRCALAVTAVAGVRIAPGQRAANCGNHRCTIVASLVIAALPRASAGRTRRVLRRRRRIHARTARMSAAVPGHLRLAQDGDRAP